MGRDPEVNLSGQRLVKENIKRKLITGNTYLMNRKIYKNKWVSEISG